MSDINYTVVSGDLPVGTDVSSGIISGTVSWENLFNAPIWVTPAGNLAVFNEDTVVPASGAGSIAPFEVQMQTGSEYVRFSIVNANVGLESRGLPWGLLLDRISGVISGKASPLLDFDAPAFLEEEAPIWDTKSGLLGNYGEKEAVSLTLLANGQLGGTVNKYSVKTGALPWGLVLNKNGTITGSTAANIFALDAAEDAPTGAPVFTMAPGLISIPLVNDLVDVTFTAAPVAPATKIVKYTIINSISTGGGLPWGLTFVPSTGRLTGTVKRPLAPLPSDLYVWPNGPIWNTPEGELVVSGENMAVNYQLDATPIVGLFDRYNVIRGALPWGLSLNIRTGKISGLTAVLNPGTEPQEPIANPPVWNDPLLVSGNPKTAGSGTNLGTFTAGAAIQFDLKATLSDPDRTMKRYTVSTLNGGIPWGMTYNTATGRLSGTPRSAAKPYVFTVTAIDSAGATSSQTFTITVN